MSPVTRRILIHGLLAGGMLAVVGVMLASLAGTWLSSQPTPRTAPEAGGLPANIAADDIGDQLQWRLPLTMAAWGFVLVAVGECLVAVFRKPAKTAPAAPTPDQQAEAIIQQILAEQQANAARAGVTAESLSRASIPPAGHSV